MSNWHTNIRKNSMGANLTDSIRWKSLIGFFLLCFLIFAFGGLFQPGQWYSELNRAPWSPPNLAFPIVWSVLYICIAITGWQIFNTEESSLKVLWVSQLILNAAWSWIFFGQHWVLIGLIDLILIDLILITLIYKAWQGGHTLIAILMSPYLAWLLLASSLNAYILIYN